jgi:hypothetical protein
MHIESQSPVPKKALGKYRFRNRTNANIALCAAAHYCTLSESGIKPYSGFGCRFEITTFDSTLF